MKKFFKLIFIIPVFILLVIAFNYTNDIRCITIKWSNEFEEISPNIFVSISTSKNEKDSLLRLVQLAEIRLNDFWGVFQIKPIIIYCNNDQTFTKYGVRGTPANTRLGQYVIINRNGLKNDIITHEICHTIIFEKIGKSYYQYYYNLPAWLDEGIALQFDNREYLYPKEEIEKFPILQMQELKNISSARKFYSSKQISWNYLAAKAEIKRFIQSKSKIELFKVLNNIKNGENAIQAYSHIRNTTIH